MTRRAPRRGGFTLIELLVVMAIVVALAGVTIVIAWSALDRDRAAAAVNKVTGSMQIARSRAHRDGLPHGVRLINNGNNLVTAYQFIYSPPVFLPAAQGFTPGPTSVNSPYLEFQYTLEITDPNRQGFVTSRVCRIHNLTYEQQLQIVKDSILYLPELGTYHRISGTSAPSQTVPPPPLFLILNDDPTFQYGYPDDAMGAATHLRTYCFGLYGPPEPLVGEEVIQLPERSCIDLNADANPVLNRSVPGLPPAAPQDYDILFAPSGQLVGTNTTRPHGHVFLWFRDPTRPNDVVNGGEQLLAVIKAQSGAMGAAPVDHAGATGAPGSDYYSLARKAVVGH